MAYNSGLWSDERLDILRVDWPAGVRNPVIMAKLNATPGGKFTSGKQVSTKADLLGLRRPEGFFKQSVNFSQERDNLLRLRYPAGSSDDELLAELNALDGPKLTKRQQLADRAKILGVKRSKEYLINQLRVARRIQEEMRKAALRPTPKPIAKPASSNPVRRPPARTPIKAQLHTIYNHGFQLWYGEPYGREPGELLSIDKRDDLEAINKAIRRAEPGHPGFQLVTRWFGA